MSLSKNIVPQKSYGLSCVLSNMVIWGIPVYHGIYMGLSENGVYHQSWYFEYSDDSPMHSEVTYFIP
jgi:hypothetical protein